MQGQIGIALRVGGFLEEVEEELNTRMHDCHIVRPAPLHQFSQWLQPGLQRITL